MRQGAAQPSVTPGQVRVLTGRSCKATLVWNAVERSAVALAYTERNAHCTKILGCFMVSTRQSGVTPGWPNGAPPAAAQHVSNWLLNGCQSLTNNPSKFSVNSSLPEHVC